MGCVDPAKALADPRYSGSTADRLTKIKVSEGKTDALLSSEFALNKNELTLYPNPASEALNVNIPYTGISEVSIYDMKGRLVFEGVTDSGSFTWELTDKSNNRVNPGVYIVKIVSGESNIVKKVLVK